MKKRIVFRRALSLIIILQTIYVVAGLNKLPEAKNDDTRDYIGVAEKIKRGEWNVIWSDNRPPGYPLVLLTAEAVGLRPHVVTPILNRVALLLFILLSPLSWATLVLGSSLSLLMSYSRFISHENLLMTESIFPGFIIAGIFLTFKARTAWCKNHFRKWFIYTMSAATLLQSLKPSFKLFPFIELIWLLPALKGSYIRKKIWSVGVVALAILNVTLFGAAGKVAFQANKALVVTHVPFQITDLERKEMSPHLRKILEQHEEYWKTRTERNGTVASYAEGAELFDFAFPRHLYTFLKAGLIRIKNLFYYSGWGEDRGNTNDTVGIPKGSGSLALFLTTTFLGILFAFAIKETNKPQNDVKVYCEILLSFIFAGASVQILGNATDVGRISLQWIPAVFTLVTLCSWQMTARFLALKNKKRGKSS